LIVLGALAGCASAMMPVGMYFTAMARRSMPTTAPAQMAFVTPGWREVIAPLVVYVLAAAVFITCGVGALRLRRWARPLVLVIAWTWAVTGVFSVVFSIRSASGYRSIMAASVPPGTPAPPPQTILIMVAMTFVFTAVFMIGLPGLFAWFFGRGGVRQTLEYFDPRPRWTDRCPTPVLAVSFWLVLAAAGVLSYLAFAVLPLFGRIFTGPSAVVGIVVIAALLVALARAVYLLRPLAWWGALALVVLMCASMVVTVARLGVEELYRSAGYTPQQIDLMTRFGGLGDTGTIALTAVGGALLIGYLLFVRRYFTETPAPSTPLPTPPP